MKRENIGSLKMSSDAKTPKRLVNKIDRPGLGESLAPDIFYFF